MLLYKIKNIEFRIFLICSLFIVHCSLLSAQTWQELNYKIKEYEKQGDEVNALFYAEKAVKQAEIEFGTQGRNYITSLNNLAGLYCKMGNYLKAESLYIEELNIRNESFGFIWDPSYTSNLNDLALLYNKMGNYAKAESLYIEALTIDNEFGEKNNGYATELNNLAELYVDLGNYAKAEQLLIKVLEIRKEILGKKHHDYTLSLNNLAGLYETIGNYAKAEPLLVEAIKIDKEVLRIKDPDYASKLNNLAGLYDLMGNYAKAEPLFTEAKIIYKELFGEKHPLYALSLNNLATLYISMNNYSKAEQLYLEALKIDKEILGVKHPLYASFLNNLGALYEIMGNYTKAEPLYIEANQILLNQLSESFSFLSEHEQQLFLEDNYSNFKYYNSYILKRQKDNPSLIDLSYNNELALKGALLQVGTQMRKNMMNSQDTAAIKILNEFQSTRQQINKLNSVLNNEKDSDYLAELEEQANELEKKLYNKSSAFKSFKDLGSIKWEDIQKNLNSDDAAIEFISFRYYNGKKWTDTTYYCALLLRKYYKQPKMIKLCTEKELESDLKRTLYKNIISENYDPHSTFNLYRLIWQPIDSLLIGIKNVYISSSGLLYKLPFDALYDGNSKLLTEKYNLHYVNSTRRIVQRNKIDSTKSVNNNYPKTIALFGGLNYNSDTTTMLKYAKLNKNKSKENNTLLANQPYQTSSTFSPNKKKGADNKPFDTLPYTLGEVNGIANMFKDKGWEIKLYTGDNGNEEAFKSLSGKQSPEIIYFSTHGYFYPDPKKDLNKKEQLSTINEQRTTNIYKLSDNPLFRSGLILAGANNKWTGKHVPDSIDDGILTAYEVSNTYLGNTDLVVMSACQTGAGDIKNSEGVYGLQRSFQMAGAKSIIMSLWDMPEITSKEFMETFMNKWLETGNKYESFHYAQKTMYEEEKSAEDKDKYFYFRTWAGFVLVE